MNVSNIRHLLKITESLNPDSIIDDNIRLIELEQEIYKVEYNSLVELLHSDKWPVATDPSLICDINSDDDKLSRAYGILEETSFLNIKNKNVLDFGCGEGHLCEKALDYGVKTVVGFDVINDNIWNKRKSDNRLFYTKDISDIIDKRFDVIFLYDVLDHVMDIMLVLKQVKSFLSANGQVYVMCHPWCSKHGAHLYHQINRAYVHLVFSEVELHKMGYKTIFTRPSIHPLGDYYSVFDGVGLKRAHQKVIREKVPSFFMQYPVISNRIKRHWVNSPDFDLRTGKKFPEFQMEQQFCEFLLVQ